jgi:four helix bundle protein
MQSAKPFPFENLDVYRLSLSVARRVHRLTWPRGRASLKDQTLRATDSIVLNIAEGSGRTGAAQRNHFGIALGSAGEALAALALLDRDTAELQNDLRRVGAMLWKLANR